MRWNSHYVDITFPMNHCLQFMDIEVIVQSKKCLKSTYINGLLYVYSRNEIGELPRYLGTYSKELSSDIGEQFTEKMTYIKGSLNRFMYTSILKCGQTPMA